MILADRASSTGPSTDFFTPGKVDRTLAIPLPQVWLDFLYGDAVSHRNEPLYTDDAKVYVTSVQVFGRYLGETASPLNQRMQWNTDITTNDIAGERPCSTHHFL